MSTKTNKIENHTKSYNNLRKNLVNQSTDTILEWKKYFTDCKRNPNFNAEYFTTAITVCDDILEERREK